MGDLLAKVRHLLATAVVLFLVLTALSAAFGAAKPTWLFPPRMVQNCPVGAGCEPGTYLEARQDTSGARDAGFLSLIAACASALGLTATTLIAWPAERRAAGAKRSPE